MIVTSRPAFRSSSISSEVTCASYDSMTTDTSGSDYARGAIIRKRGASLAPTTPPPNDQPLVAPTKVQVVSSSPTILEMEKEGDNDASTVRSPSMRTYREGDDKRLAGFGGFTSIHQQQDQMQNEEVELVPGPVRVSLTDEGVHGSDSQEVPGAQFHTNGQADTTQQFINGEILEKNIVPGSRYVELVDAPVTREQVAAWLGGIRGFAESKASRPISISATNPHSRSRQSSSSTSRFSRPFIKIATALSGSPATKSPTSGPNSGTSMASHAQLILGHPLPPGTSMKTIRSRSSNGTSSATSPTSNGWRRSFLGPRPTSRLQQRPKSMQIVPRTDQEMGAACYDKEEKRWIPAVTEPARRFSMSGESDDNNLSDVAPSFASSLSGSGAVKSSRRQSSFLRRVPSAQRSFTSAGSSVFLPTPREEKDEESAFEFLSGLGTSTSVMSAMKGSRPRTSSASKDGASNGRFIKMLRRISGHGWKEDDQLRRVASPDSVKSDKRLIPTSHRTMTPDSNQSPSEHVLVPNTSSRFPASFSSFANGTGAEEAGCPPPLSAGQLNQTTDLAPPVMYMNRPHPRSLSAENVPSLKSVDEEESATPCQILTPGVTETNPYVDIMSGCGARERPAVQECSNSLQTVG